MKTEPNKKNKIPYTIIFTTQFNLYFTKKEEDEGIEISKELIKEQIIKCIELGNYEIQEESVK